MLLPKIMLIAFGFSLAVIIACGVVISNSSATKDSVKFSVGVVGTKEDSYLGMGLNLLKNVDDIKNMLDIIEFDSEEEAKQALDSREISAYAVIPPEFVDSINYFRNDSQIRYYSDSGQKGLSNVIMDEVSTIASNIIICAEAGLFTLQDILNETQIDSQKYWEDVNSLFMEIMSVVIIRSELTEIEDLGMSLGLTTFAYYFTTFSLIYIMLISFAKTSYHIGQTKEFERMAFAFGINKKRQVMSEYVAIFVGNVACFIIFELLFGIVFATGIIKITEFGDNPVGNFLLFGLGMIPVIMLISAMEMFLFEIISGLINKIVVVFMLYLIFTYISGFFYPKEILPAAVRFIGEYIPTGVSFEYLRMVIQKKSILLPIIEILIYMSIFIAGTIWARRHNINKGGAE